jgi:ribosome biogenesis protein BMS1
MIDVAKIADLTLLLIDASFGFEMETMEYLNILSCHGMTRIFGILTHLDLIKKVSTVRAVKKRLKHRFWTEIYDGAKLFYLSGVLNGRYPDREILNLSRFISVLKFRPLVWQSAHPYVLVDRMEELTPPQDIEENLHCDRTVTLYGYLRGTNVSAIDPKVHVPGVGDFTVSQVTGLPDPCPSPAAVARDGGLGGGKVRRRTLTDKQKMIYAPMSDAGGIMFDKDAVYITVPEKQSFTRIEDEEAGVGESLIMRMHDRRNGLDSKDGGLQLFTGAEEITSLPALDESEDTGRKERRRPHNRLDAQDVDAWEEEHDDGDNVDEEIDDGDEEDVHMDDISRARLPVDLSDDDEDLSFAESDSDMGEPDSGNEDGLDASMCWKENLSEKAALSYQNSRKMDVTRLMYGCDPVNTLLRKWQEFIGVLGADTKDTEGADEPDQGEDEDDFFKKAPDSKEIGPDGSVPQYTVEKLNEWTNEEKTDSIRNRFITSDLVTNDAEAQDEAEFGHFEDLEATETSPVVDESQGSHESLDLEAERAANAKRKEESRLRLEEVEEDPDSLEHDEDVELAWGERQKAKLQRQVELNQREFEGMDMASRVRVEGYLPGTYVRMVLHGVPCEFVQQFDANHPIIVGGLLNDEQRFGYIQVMPPFYLLTSGSSETTPLA